MIFWKEWRETVPLMILAAIAVPLISLIRWEGWRLEFFEFQFWAVAVLCLPFMLIFMGAAAVAGERENNTLEALLAKPATPVRIFLTKYLVRLGCMTLLFPILVAVFHFLRPTHNLNLYDVARGLVILFGFLLFCFTLAFCVSCFTNTAAKAFVAAVILVYMTIFITNNTPFFTYSWWWSNSLDELWRGYFYFYAALSLALLVVGGVLFGRKIVVDYSWRVPAVAAILLFLVFIRTVSTTFWLIPRIAMSGDMDFVKLCREPIVKILEYTSRHDKERARLLHEYIQASHDSRMDKELIRELSNPDARIRNEAVKMLSARGTQKARADVIPLLNDPDDEVRHSALTFVIIFKCKEAAPALRDLIHDPNSSIRQKTVLALAEIEGKDAAPYLLEALKDPNPRVHSIAAHGLCRLDCAEAQGEIVRMMFENPIKHTRRSAAGCLGFLRSAPACDALIEALTVDDDKLVRGAVQSLGQLQCEDAVGPLIELLNDDSFWDQASKHGWNKTSVIWALKSIGGEEAKQALKTRYAGTAATDILKLELAVSLLEMGDPVGVPYLRELMARDTSEKKDEWINSTYATRLLKAGDFSGVPVLIRLTGESYPQRRYEYGKTLSELTGKNYGWDTRKWENWWENNRDALL